MRSHRDLEKVILTLTTPLKNFFFHSSQSNYIHLLATIGSPMKKTSFDLCDRKKCSTNIPLTILNRHVTTIAQHSVSAVGNGYFLTVTLKKL